MTIIAVRVNSMLLMATDTGRHIERAKRAIRRLGRLFHGAVTFGARQVCYGDMSAMGEENVRSRLRQLQPVQLLAGRGDRTHPFFFRAVRKCHLVTTNANVYRWKGRLRLCLHAGVAVRASHAVADVLGVVKRDRLFGRRVL
jgi:hypothetical protein